MIYFNNFRKEYSYIKKEIDSSIAKVLRSGTFILGKMVESFEESFANYLGVKYCIGVGNGLDALKISLMALGIGKGDEVITTPLSAVATALPIKEVGAVPIFIDIDEFYHIDTKKIENKITKKARAIIPVHLYGQSVDLESIIKISKKYNLYVIEDAAQAHGADFKGKKVGTFGELGCFSFYPTKNLGAYGDGGAIVTNNKELYEKCKMIRNYGQRDRYRHDIIGVNSRLDEIQAAILLTKLKHLDYFNNERKKIANNYREFLNNIDKIKLPKIRENANHVFHLFVIEAENRNMLRNYLKSYGITTLVHYPIPIHKQKCFSEFNKLNLPVVEKKVENILSLPIHPFLSKKDINYVAKKIKDFYSKGF